MNRLLITFFIITASINLTSAQTEKVDSLKGLALKLTTGLISDRQKVDAIFYWVVKRSMQCMRTALDKYIEIKNLSDPKKAFERMGSEFIDVMYTDHFSGSSVIMLLDVNIDPLKQEDMVWLKGLLDTVLPEIGETQYFLTPFSPKITS